MRDQVKGSFLFFFFITERFHDLNLVALPFVTAVGGIRIRRILKRIRWDLFGFFQLNRIVFIFGQIAVLFQNSFKQFITIHDRHIRAALKLLDQIKQIPADHRERFLRLRGLYSGKASESGFGKIFVYNDFIDGVESVLMASFQIH